MDNPTNDATNTVTPSAAAVAALDITVLSGGPSAEREVSLASGKCIAAGLVEKGHRVTVADIGPDDLSALERRADVVFVALHGAFGEDGVVQLEMQRRGVRFTGTDAAGSALAMDKVRSKAKFIEKGLPTPRFDVARRGNIRQVVERWRMPVVVKPVNSGSSVDTCMVQDERVLCELLHKLVDRYGEALVEELIEGPELTVGVVGRKALPIIEIQTGRTFYDYQAKYIDDDTRYRFEIDLPPALLARVSRESLAAAEAIGYRDFCRVDWMVDRVTHEPYLLEVNTIPGFTTHSLLPKAAARIGMSFGDLCQNIVELAMSRSVAK